MGVPANEDLRVGKATDCEEAIKRFRRTYRRRLRQLARTDPALSDLIVTFPVAALVIVTNRGPAARRREAMELVKHGQPLKAVAKALELPFWMRKLPPETFSGDLPQRLPDDPQFGARLAGLIPESKLHVSGWFKGVVASWAVAGEPFAHWVACNPGLVPSNVTSDGIEALALFAWASGDSTGPVAKLLPARWNPQMSAHRAGANTLTWINLVRRELVLGKNGLGDPWLNPGRAGSFRFVALASVADLQSEADAMDNCVMDYAEDLVAGECRLFAIRRGSTHVATVEIRPHRDHDRIPEIAQLRGPNNEDVPDRVWQAAFQWLGQQKSYNLPVDPDEGAVQPDATTWRQFWRPFWRNVGEHRLLPEEPTREALQQLVSAAQDISRRTPR